MIADYPALPVDDDEARMVQIVGEIMAEGDEALVGPYRDRLTALRDAGKDEEAIYGDLKALAERRKDDFAEVFAVLCEEGSIIRPFPT
jgi:hypothetical protein